MYMYRKRPTIECSLDPVVSCLGHQTNAAVAGQELVLFSDIVDNGLNGLYRTPHLRILVAMPLRSSARCDLNQGFAAVIANPRLRLLEYQMISSDPRALKVIVSLNALTPRRFDIHNFQHYHTLYGNIYTKVLKIDTMDFVFCS